MSTPVVLHGRAIRDVDTAVDYYVAYGSPLAAERFIDALENAYRHIAEYTASGSLRIAHELQLSGLRSWPLFGFPYLVFYLMRTEQVDVWRVLHSQRDITPVLARQALNPFHAASWRSQKSSPTRLRPRALFEQIFVNQEISC
jgi:toxin ParE1/3/4